MATVSQLEKAEHTKLRSLAAAKDRFERAKQNLRDATAEHKASRAALAEAQRAAKPAKASKTSAAASGTAEE